jgi:hypothetical protein
LVNVPDVIEGIAVEFDAFAVTTKYPSVILSVIVTEADSASYDL